MCREIGVSLGPVDARRTVHVSACGENYSNGFINVLPGNPDMIMPVPHCVFHFLK